VDGNSDDADLEAELRHLADSLDPVPPEAISRAVQSLTWRTIDAELAELSFDSLVDDGGALVRGTGQPRSLTFRAGDRSIELEVTCERGTCTVVGQLLPPGPAILRVRHSAGIVSIEADELGRFSAQALPTGPLSVQWQPRIGAARPAVVTDWISI
jgi:hypothetical protein